MKRIIIIGYMGAGKTTVGKALSKELGIAFYDLDWYIESRMRKTVSQIFAEKGEEGFRKIEYNMLHEVAEFEDIIISCGGGTPCFFDNIDYLNQQGETIYLKARPDVLYGHLKMAKVERPLLKDKSPEEMQQFTGKAGAVLSQGKTCARCKSAGQLRENKDHGGENPPVAKRLNNTENEEMDN